MFIYDMEVQCFKMWDRVTDEKLQNASSFINNLEFGNLSLSIYCSFIPVKVYARFDIITKIVKLSLKLYLTCYDYILYGSAVL